MSTQIGERCRSDGYGSVQVNDDAMAVGFESGDFNGSVQVNDAMAVGFEVEIEISPLLSPRMNPMVITNSPR